MRFACLAVIGAALASLCGCFESQLFTCGPDRVCPVGYQCTASHTCLSPSELAACEGMADGQPCTINMIMGTCREGGCLVAFCGNGVIDEGEVCDDGNEAGGDGCNGTCTSDETCGNGFVELDEACDCGDQAHPGPTTCKGTVNGGTICSDGCTLRHCGDGVLDPGEVCDDGNMIAGDGCNFACTSTEVCGNGIVDYFVGEECDGGAGCNATCGLYRCGNGTLEPGEICDDGNTVPGDGCTFDCSSNETCGNGIIDYFKGEECDGGNTCNGNCKLFRCGNSMLDPGEVCDDGNTTPGDGCNYDCTSDETCGNGILDYFASEQCDDGGTASRDGCSSGCRGESRVWQNPVALGAQSPSWGCGMAYDIARDRTVALAGQKCGQTWEIHGITWTQKTLALSPSGRMFGALAYDSKRARTVLFGGNSSGALLGDTWEYDGVKWTSMSPATSPSPRERTAMAFDPRRGTLVMFGGLTGSGTVGETWEYNGVTWKQRSPTVSPSARHGAVMAYDAKRGVMVLFGGWIGSPAQIYYDETWEYDGTTWTKATPTASPPGRESASMTFDTSRGQMVMFGGSPSGGAVIQDTWAYDGTTWTDLSPTTPPTARRDAAMTYVMGTRQRVMLYGGNTGSAVGLSDVYELVGTAWTPMPAPSTPSARTELSLAYDAKRGKVVMFGGSTGGAETWELDTDGVWTLRAPGTSPTARTGPAMAFDPVHGVIVLFGGKTSMEQADTWIYDGTTWTDVSPTGSPPVRIGASMAWDPDRQRIVMFGGRYNVSGANMSRADTWEWDGSSWTQRTLTMSPSGRHYAAMTYDRKNARMVLYGGFVGSGTLTSDTWILSGSSWSQLNVTSGPPSNRRMQYLTYEAARDVVVLLAGTQSATDPVEHYFLDASVAPGSWKMFGADNPPPSRYLAGAVYDELERRIVLFGGTNFSATMTTLNDTWTLVYQQNARSEACGSGIDTDGDGNVGCADTDCWAVCTPVCPPAQTPSTCPTTPACGDGFCGDVEDCRSCPSDCAAGTPTCPITCGDTHCETGETSVNCPGDCP